MKNASPKFLAALAVAGALASGSAMAQDVMTVGSGSNAHAGDTLNIPISIRDTPATTLNVSSSPARIQGIGVRVHFSPAASVDIANSSITKAGICAGLTGETKLDGSGADYVGTNVTWPVATAPIPFVESASGIGQQCLSLNVKFAAGATFPVTLSVDSSNAFTFLTDSVGTAGTLESVANGRLTLANGQVTPVSLQKFDAE